MQMRSKGESLKGNVMNQNKVSPIPGENIKINHGIIFTVERSYKSIFTTGAKHSRHIFFKY